jgi:hypothetical protein
MKTKEKKMKLGDVMLAAICGLVIVVSAVHINSQNSNSTSQVEYKK